MRTSEVLNRAADLIEERGWTTGSTGWPGMAGGDELCLEGGILAALGLGFLDVPLRQFWSCPAYAAVADYLQRDVTVGPVVGGGTQPQEPLWSWNDAQPDAGPVIETLRAAAIIEAAKEDEALAAEFLTWQGSEISA